MSRGPGAVQRFILDELADSPTRSMPTAELERLWHQWNHNPYLDIPRSVTESVNRAIRSLVTARRVLVVQDWDEHDGKVHFYRRVFLLAPDLVEVLGYAPDRE